MNTQIRPSAERNQHAPSAERRVRNPGRGWNLNRAAAAAAIVYLGLAWLARPVSAADYTDELSVASFVNQMLYWPDADLANKTNAAFRYKHLLYRDDGTSVCPSFTNMSSLYGQAERTRAQQAETHLQAGLTNHPASSLLGCLLLDLYYDRATAEAILAREAVEKAERSHFGDTIAAPAPPSGFIIDNEIPAYDCALQSNRVVLATYLRVLTNTFGIVDGDPTPFGYRLFQRWVPERGLTPAWFTNSSGQVEPVTGSSDLFAGYKDLVFLYDMLRDQGRTAAVLARLYILRNSPGDLNRADALITETKRDLFIHVHILRTVFPTPAADVVATSGLAAALAGVGDSLAQLDHLTQSRRGGLNPLGFADDFLFFANETGRDSFDVIQDYLGSQNSNPLRAAITERSALESSYKYYRESQDQLAAEFADSSITYMDRLRDIVGVFPDHPLYGAHPTNHQGSELALQYREIDRAQLHINRNNAEIDNLRQQVLIELDKAASISDVTIYYGNQQARITEEISYVNAVQAAANAMAEAANSKTIWGAGAHVGNAMVQSGGELIKGSLEAQKERTAAQERATITGIEATNAVKALLLNMNLLAIDSQEAALQLNQEADRLLGLLREKQDLESKLAQRDNRLVRRYFADPVHRLSVQSRMIRADLAFEKAQQFLFYMARSLEYKWNERNNLTPSLYKARNATELNQLYDRMGEFDFLHPTYTMTPLQTWFSVREDFFGYKRTNYLGQILYYTDPATGQQVDAIAAFRSQVRRLHDPVDGLIRLELSTVRELEGSFFRGPRFTISGVRWNDGYWLDKIDALMINLPGQHQLGVTEIEGEISYGGTSYLRNQFAGSLDDQRPDRLLNEWTTYATTHWYYINSSSRWESDETRSVSIPMQLTATPRVLNPAKKRTDFQERSVAASRWQLTIPTWDWNGSALVKVLDIDQLDDIEIHFDHHASAR